MSKAPARGFQYKERSRDAIRERANARGGDYDSFIKPKYKKYKIKEGKNLLRIMPPTWEGAEHYGLDLFVNYDIGVDNQSYLSLSKMKNEKDPLDEARREAQREGDEKLAKALQPRQRVLMWVIDRSDEEEGPQLLDAPFTLDKSFANIALDEDTKEVVFIDDPEQGCDVRFYREGTGLNTKYDASKMRLLPASPLHEDESIQGEWLDFIKKNALPDCLQFYDYDHISGMFGGMAGTRDKDKDEDDAPKPRGRKPPADEDEAPPPKAKPRTRVVDDEDATPTLQKRTRVVDEEPDDEPAPPPKSGASIRDRLKQRRSASTEKEAGADPEEDE